MEQRRSGHKQNGGSVVRKLHIPCCCSHGFKIIFRRVTLNVMSAVYEINKGINRSIEFKGIKAQYIVYLAVGLVVLLLLFAIMYVIGINIYICVILIFSAGTALFTYVKRYSKKYGEHGLIKKAAQSRLPAYITSSSRNLFIQLSEVENEKDKEAGKRTSNIEN
jgi:hypothetical protein